MMCVSNFLMSHGSHTNARRATLRKISKPCQTSTLLEGKQQSRPMDVGVPSPYGTFSTDHHGPRPASHRPIPGLDLLITHGPAGQGALGRASAALAETGGDGSDPTDCCVVRTRRRACAKHILRIWIQEAKRQWVRF